jgi:hypothetical protein
MITAPPETISTAEWLSRVQLVGPVITEHRDTSERQRTMAQPMFDALATTGFFDRTGFSIPLPMFFTGPHDRPSTACRTPFYDIAAPAITAVGLGIARDAIDSFVQLAASKIPAIGTVTLANQHTVQQSVGKAEALVRSAHAYLYTTMDDVSGAHAAGAAVTDQDSATMRLATSYAAQCAVEAVDLMFDAAGGSSIYEVNHLERCFRDVHMITHHMMASPATIEMVGQFLLGGPLQPRR